jgi:hypothetical protein
MADNVAITAGSGTPIATDEVAVNGGSSAHVQYVKLVDGTANGTDGVPGTTQGLAIVNRRDVKRIEVNVGGLTTATTAYTAGDQVGGLITFADAARASGGSGTIVGWTLTDAADIIGAYDLVFFDSSVTPATNNDPFSISDSDLLKVVALTQGVGGWDMGGCRLTQAHNLGISYVCDGGTSLYGLLINRFGHTWFSATTDLEVVLYVERN